MKRFETGRSFLPSLLIAVALVLGCLAGTAAVPAVALADEGGEWSASEPPELSSAAAYLVESSTGTVLLDKNADERREPASTTKVMTALLVLENANLDDEVTVIDSDFDEVTSDSSVAGLIAGETLTVRDLLACLMLPSGNDASYVLARHVGGDWHAFVDMMNTRAAELGCENTHFANPCGLPDDDHYTTARDLATIFEAAMEHPEFVEIAGSLTWDLPETTQNPARTLENTNFLIDPESSLYMDGVVTAGKTGTTMDAGRCLVASAQSDGMSLVGVALGAPYDVVDNMGAGQNFYDMRSMLEWGFGAWQTGDVVSAGDVLGVADVELSSTGETVEALSDGAITATVPRGTTLADLTLTPTWEGTDAQTGAFMAPVEKNQTLGTVDISLGDRWLASLSVSAAQTMELSIPDYLMWWLSDPIHIAIVVVVLVVLFVVIGLVASSSSRRRRSRYQMAVGRRPTVAPGVGSQDLRLPTKRRAPSHGRHARR